MKEFILLSFIFSLVGFIISLQVRLTFAIEVNRQAIIEVIEDSSLGLSTEWFDKFCPYQLVFNFKMWRIWDVKKIIKGYKEG
jgi:hypothetical protein